MRISHSSYQNYLANLKKKYQGQKLFSPLLLNEETIVFPLMEESRKSIVISLNTKSPLVYQISDDHFFSSFENKQIQKLRKLFGKSILEELYLDENDFVVHFYIYNDEVQEKYHLIVELVANHPNLIVLKDGKIIDYYFHSKSRGFLVGEKYSPLKDNDLSKDGEEITEELIKAHHDEEWNIRREEKYRPFVKYIISKINLNKKKIKNIEGDVAKAKENLVYEDIANEIFALNLNLKSHLKEVEVLSKKVSLNESKTLYENIESFYKKAKKAKETISRSEVNIENAKKELKEYEDILAKYNASNEKQADELVELYGQVKKKKEVKETIFNRPYKLNLNGTIIYFGRNASQNDYLSFVMKLDREFTWLHIKDKSGAHLVIASRKPTENELLFACEVSLLCSRATSGEVVYTKKKNVRRGHVLGEAILKNHSTIKLNNIRKETVEAFALAKRVD